MAASSRWYFQLSCAGSQAQRVTGDIGIGALIWWRPSIGYRDSAATFCSIAPKTLCPSLPFISIRMVSPNFMNSVAGLPSWMVSMARFSAMQL